MLYERYIMSYLCHMPIFFFDYCAFADFAAAD